MAHVASLSAAIIVGGSDRAASQGLEGAGRGALSEITIIGQSGRRSFQEPGTVQHISEADIRSVAPVSVSDALVLASGAHLQTNSRGETLVFLRGAGERQVAVFYDGALLNVPWDNRVDLSVVPADAIGGITVAKGASSLQYGANTIGGAVNVTARSPLDAPQSVSGSVRRGGDGLWDADAGFVAQVGPVGIAAGGGYFSSDGIPLSGDAELPFNQIGEDVRTNTDSEAANVYLNAETRLGAGGRARLSIFYIDAEKGVAPEGNVDPALDSPRFWRLPQWEMLTAILSGEGAAPAGLDWKGSVWVQSFDQTIDSFTGIAFDTLDERQRDDNLTIGGRGALSGGWGAHDLTYSANILVSTHDQRNLPGGDISRAEPELRFRQWTVSNALEYDWRATNRLSFGLGGGIDLFTAPRTGDKPGLEDFTEWSLIASAAYDIGDGWSLQASGGRKTRFPTLRELFGQAINRFLINPDLQAESAILADLTLAWQKQSASFEITPFANFSDGTIDQRNVTVDGRSLRQRINLPGSRILGLEVTGQGEVTERLSVSGHVTVMDIHRKPAFAGDFTKLSEKPQAIGRLALDYRLLPGLNAGMDIEYRGRAFTLDDDDRFVPLEKSTAFNLRLSYDLAQHLSGLERAEFYLRADNLTDTLVEPQLGLPAAGRRISGGLTASF